MREVHVTYMIGLRVVTGNVLPPVASSSSWPFNMSFHPLSSILVPPVVLLCPIDRSPAGRNDSLTLADVKLETSAPPPPEPTV